MRSRFAVAVGGFAVLCAFVVCPKRARADTPREVAARVTPMLCYWSWKTVMAPLAMGSGLSSRVASLLRICTLLKERRGDTQSVADRKGQVQHQGNRRHHLAHEQSRWWP